MIEVKFTGPMAVIRADMLDFLQIKLVGNNPAVAPADQPTQPAETTAAPEGEKTAKTRGRPKKTAETPAPAAQPEQPPEETFVLDQGGTKVQCTLANIEETFNETIGAIETVTDLVEFSKRNNDMLVAVGAKDEDTAQRLLDAYKARKATLTPAASDPAAKPAAVTGGAVPSLDDARQALRNMADACGPAAAVELLKEYTTGKVPDIAEDKRADFIKACFAATDAKKAEG